MSNDIQLTQEQFDKFTKHLPDHNLILIEDQQAFPLDFTCIYDSKYLMHFEYLGGFLEYSIIGTYEDGTKLYYIDKVDNSSLAFKEFDARLRSSIWIT